MQQYSPCESHDQNIPTNEGNDIIVSSLQSGPLQSGHPCIQARCPLSVAKFIQVHLCIELIRHMKIHEGKRLAVCLRLPSSRSSSQSGSRWLIYSVQHLQELARLYSALKTAMARSRSV
jgi:hypothetical protein